MPFGFGELEDFNEWVLHGEGKCFLGVELEMDDGGCSSDNGNLIISTVNSSGEVDHAIFKDDGSLCNGLEIISHPCTLEYHKEWFNWRGLLDKAEYLDYGTEGYNEDRDEEYETAGLHVHVSRSAFGDTWDDQEYHIAKMALIIEKFPTQVFSFSRRDREKFRYYSPLFGSTDFDYILDRIKNNNHKYQAVNTRHSYTVELRLFKSTLNYDTLIGTIEFCQLLVNVATSHSLEEINGLTWNDLMQKGLDYGFNAMLDVAESQYVLVA